MHKHKSGFSSNLGFIMAAAGSAVGLGNLWRFPYLAAKYGGGTFLLIYIILVITFGFTLMITEITIGRKTGASPISAYTKLSKKFKFLGYIACIVPAIIVPYYCVIGGWVVKYLLTFITGAGQSAAQDPYFGQFISQSGEPVLWFALFAVLSAAIVIMGVKNGVEKAGKILMPMLVVLSVAIAIYVLTIPNSLGGITYYLIPDFSKFSINSVLAALGQLFYSMSLSMGILITYGSYMSKKDNIEKSVRRIELFDTLIAFISGLIIVPAVFTFSGGDEAALGQGPGLMFSTLPKVFESMPIGDIVGAVFFLLVLFAALTSSISLMETLVSIISEKTGFGRKKTTIICLIYVFVVGVPVSLGFGVWSNFAPLGMDLLTFLDFISNSVIMPIVALLTCVLIGYVVKPKAVIDEIKTSGNFKSEKIYVVLIKYISPIFLLLILVSSVLNGLGIVVL